MSILKIKEISMERTMCFGTCPVFKATFRSDGECIYEGRDNVNKIGVFTGKIEGRDFCRLTSLIEKLHLLDLKDSYCTRDEDRASVITEVIYENGRKKINNHGDSGPVELWAMERVVDSIIEDIYWEEARK